MPRLVYEGRTAVYWATTIASIAAPTVAEITAAVKLTAFVAKDGVATNETTNNVDSATILETFDAEIVGSFGASVQITLFRDDTTDTAWALCVYGTNGYLIIDRFADGAALPIATDKVEVWPAEMHQPVMANSGANTQQRFTEAFAITAAPNKNAVVAA